MRHKIFLLLQSWVCLSSGYHVLFYHNLGRRAHLMQMTPIMEELLDHGHQVTSIFFDSVDLVHDNYTELLLPSDLGDLMWEINKALDGKQMVEKGRDDSNKVINNVMDPTRWWTDYKMMDKWIDKAGEMSVQPSHINKFLKSGVKVDAVVAIYPQMSTTVAEIFDCPIILFSHSGPLFHFTADLGKLANRNLVPLLSSPFVEPMTFRQRLQNHILYYTTVPMMNWLGDRVYQQQKKILGIELPTQEHTLRSRSTIIISNSHPVTHGPHQYPSKVVEVGGIQLRSPKALPDDLTEFINKSNDGVVVVSLGSSLRPDMMPHHKLQILLETFSKLNIPVIWKWTEEVPNLPPNVLIRPWLPQQDLLAHPKVKVFLSHGGLGSITESIYHQTVMVGIPVSNDQKQFMARAVREGYTRSVDWETMSVDKLVDSIKTVMEDEDIKHNLERVHSIYTDQKEDPKQKAAWWVELVCKHGNTDWLRSEIEDVGYIVTFQLDIIIFLIFISLISILSSIFCCRKIFTLCMVNKTKIE